MKTDIEVHGHRGARAVLPENTIPAFEHALKVGADVLELDLAVTRDGTLVVSHDPEISPTLCLGPGGKPLSQGVLIRSLTLKELKQYDCGALKNPRFPEQMPVPGTRVPTLREVYEHVSRSRHPSARRVQFNIETKITPEHPDKTVSPREFARLVVKEIRRSKQVARTIVQSFDYRTLREVRRIEPKIRIAALSEAPGPGWIDEVRELGAEIASPQWEKATDEMIAAFHSAKVRVVPWTANTQESWDKLIALKADGIITDDPAKLVEYLKFKNKAPGS